MSTLQDIKDYFKGEKFPIGHPYQDPQDKNLSTSDNPRLEKKPEEPFGYKKDKLVNDSKKNKSLEVDN
jgi:hypothetical protein